MYPKYLYRLDDGERFTLNADGETYSMDNTYMEEPYKYFWRELMEDCKGDFSETPPKKNEWEKMLQGVTDFIGSCPVDKTPKKPIKPIKRRSVQEMMEKDMPDMCLQPKTQGAIYDLYEGGVSVEDICSYVCAVEGHRPSERLINSLIDMLNRLFY